MRTRTTPKYIKVRDTILYQIRSGQLLSGDRIASRREICERYGISPMTAHKVQKELQRTGLVDVIAGEGVFVSNARLSPQAENSTKKLSKVRLIGAEFAIGPQTVFGSRLIDGMRERCVEFGLEFSVQYIEVSMPYNGIMRNDYKVSPDEGLLFIYHSFLLPEVVLLLLSPDIRTVMVNNFFPGIPCVIPDNRAGIHSMLEYVQERGCRKVFFAGGLTPNLHFNENERVDFFREEMKKFALQGEALVSDSFDEVIDLVNQQSPDAILFPSDTAALIFRRVSAKRLDKRPILVGFDNISESEPGLESLVSYAVDCEGMGRSAVDLLRQSESTGTIPLNTRIPGKIVIR